MGFLLLASYHLLLSSIRSITCERPQVTQANSVSMVINIRICMEIYQIISRIVK